ncbi:fungal specific transcription factor domain-containing protein [Aspergillus novofumigatus IBT 16806]|uniref:Putative fungal-specific transcription factor n=1 Tax=Aspergillus novofumigatus (strain IBT 16806) TaxID=1392255 RepID=A0A2I1CI46_ASPN1|nr:putative fungal-specific transcription factor [Aspergillus novofumigatus IBT 16806]PKX97298.1 putative fungal-specific transcription factor [Aspergillus novofumigatus IBT 16806]
MPAEDISALLGMDKVAAIKTYRAATEHALMRANFLVTDDLVVLQAFVLFLSLSSFTDEAKLVWPLTGIAQRLLTTDSTGSDDPVSQEIRRRLYWQLWYMDKRAIEDQGKSAVDTTQDTVSLPRNISDTELDLGHTSSTTQEKGWTEASFLLIRLDIARTRSSLATAQSLYEKEQLIQRCHNRIKSRYLVSCDGSQPIHWLAKHVSSVLIAEMWFEIHSAACSFTLGAMISSRSTRAKLFSTAVSIVDIPRRVHEDRQAKAWSWLLKGYLQFQPLWFVAAELSSRSMGDSLSVRAWEVAHTAFGRWPEETRRTRQGKLLDGLLRKSQERWRGMQQEAALATASLLTVPLADEAVQESDKLGPSCQ